MTQYGFHFDGSRCTGCKTCTLSCKDKKELTSEQSFRKVFEYGAGAWAKDEVGSWTTDSFTYYVSVACNHCENPACVAICPQKSMEKHEDTGLVFNDAATCIGCGSCVEVCPYGMPALDTEKKLSIKCDGCHERVEADMLPICIESCPQRALEFGEFKDLKAKHGDTTAIAPLPDPTITNPSIVIKAPVKGEAWDKPTGSIENKMELV